MKNEHQQGAQANNVSISDLAEQKAVITNAANQAAQVIRERPQPMQAFEQDRG